MILASLIGWQVAFFVVVAVLWLLGGVVVNFLAGIGGMFGSSRKNGLFERLCIIFWPVALLILLCTEGVDAFNAWMRKNS